MRWIMVSLLILSVAACTVRRPTERAPVLAVYPHTSAAEVIGALKTVLAEERIPVSAHATGGATIVTDSFVVLPEYCDCGRNFFGAEYPGIRRGQMKLTVTDGGTVRVKIEFATLLTITANNKHVHCTSFGILEEKLLKRLEERLRTARSNAQN